MKIANIVPAGLLESVLEDEPDENYHLILCSQALSEGNYLDFYSDVLMLGQHVILDNDAYEQDGKSSPERVIIRTLNQFARAGVQPTQIVLPDVMYGENCDFQTLNLSTSAAKNLLEEMQWKWNELGYTPDFIGVPHGDTMEAFLQCAQGLCRIPNVTTLGIAEKDAIKLVGGHREKLVRALHGLGKRIHLFGMMEDMQDLHDPWVRLAVQGVDGAKLVVWGLDKKRVFLNGVPRYPGRPENFFDLSEADVSVAQVNEIKWNMSLWRRYVAGEA